MISAEGLERKWPDSESAKKAQDASIALLRFMQILHHDDVSNARVQMSVKHLLEEMRSDFSNYSLILVKYLEPCDQIVEKPGEFLEGWMDRELNQP